MRLDKAYEPMTLFILAVIAGLAALVWSADQFVAGAAATARNLGVSTMIIGLTIIGFGTSAPELLISSLASLQGNPGIAIGNALGSNIANITLILGVAALISPLVVGSTTVKREIPVLLLVTAVAAGAMYDFDLTVINGLLMIGTLAAAMVWLARKTLSSRDALLDSEYAAEIPHDLTTSQAVVKTLYGLAVLMASAQALVWGAENIARDLGVSELVIGLTIVAVGTSLPELAASIASVRKNEHDLVIGNVIGSNMFNTGAVIGIPALLAPGELPAEAVTRDLPISIGLTLLMLIFAMGIRRDGRINRMEGGILLAGFVGYQMLLMTTL